MRQEYIRAWYRLLHISVGVVRESLCREADMMVMELLDRRGRAEDKVLRGTKTHPEFSRDPSVMVGHSR
jgi:hypothetical protein